MRAVSLGISHVDFLTAVLQRMCLKLLKSKSDGLPVLCMADLSVCSSENGGLFMETGFLLELQKSNVMHEL